MSNNTTGIEDSRLKDLVNTYTEIPTEAEDLEIKRQIIEHEVTICDLEDKIKEMSAILFSLTKLRDEKKNQIQNLRMATSLVRRLPLEVLVRIFVLCLEYDPKKWFLDPRQPPLLLGNVCSHWRSVSHATPQLWKALSVPWNGLMRNEHVHRVIATATKWLTRAHPLPLDVALINTPPYALSGSIFSVPLSDPIDLKHTLFRHPNQIQKLRLSLPFHYLASLLSSYHGGMPILEIVDLDHIRNGEGAWRKPPITFLNYPRLRTIILSSHELLRTDMVVWPWLQLTTVTLAAPISNSTIRSVLSLAPNIESLSVIVSDHQDQASPGVYPNLRTLHIMAHPNHPNSGPDQSLFFESLNCPALRSLTIDRPSERTLNESLTEWQYRSNFKLESLIFGRLEKSSKSLVSLISCLPTLTKLHLHFRVLSNKILLDALRYDKNDSILPHLEELEITAVNTIVWTPGDFIEMIQSRWRPDHVSNVSATPLRCATLKYSRKEVLSSEDEKQLRKLRMQGLVLEISGVRYGF